MARAEGESLSPPIDPLTFQIFYVRVAISLAILACSLCVILSKRFEARQKQWAYSVVCTLLGYWLRV